MEIVKDILLSELTYAQTGRKYDISVERVRQVFTKALRGGAFRKSYKRIEYKDIKSTCKTARLNMYYDILSYERRANS